MLLMFPLNFISCPFHPLFAVGSILIQETSPYIQIIALVGHQSHALLNADG